MDAEELERKHAQSEISAVFDATVDKGYAHVLPSRECARTATTTSINAWYYDSYDFWTSDWTPLPSDAEYAFERAPSRLGRVHGLRRDGRHGVPGVHGVGSTTAGGGRERARCRRQYSAEFIKSTFTDCNFIGRPKRCRTVLSLPQGEFQTNPDEVTIDRCFSYMQDGGQLYAEGIRVDGGKWEQVYHDYDAAGRLVETERRQRRVRTSYTLDAEGESCHRQQQLQPDALLRRQWLGGGKNPQALPTGGEKFVQRMEYDYGDDAS